MTGTGIPLQAGILFDSVPRWLPPLSILLGIELVLIRYIERSINVERGADFGGTTTSDRPITVPRREYQLIIAGLTIGILVSAIAVIQRYSISRAYAMLLLFCGRIIEGSAAVRTYKKVIHFIRTRSWNSDFSARVRHKLLMLFILILGFYMMGYALLNNAYFRSLGFTIQLIWTLMSLLLTTLGLRWKLRYVSDDFDNKVILGVILFVTGAELFNYTILQAFIATLVGSIGYAIGFWFAAGYLIRDQSEPVAMRIKSVIRRVRLADP